jgi:hypothetical protein
LFEAPDKLSLNRGQHVTILFYVCQNFSDGAAGLIHFTLLSADKPNLPPKSAKRDPSTRDYIPRVSGNPNESLAKA